MHQTTVIYTQSSSAVQKPPEQDTYTQNMSSPIMMIQYPILAHRNLVLNIGAPTERQTTAQQFLSAKK